MRLRLPLGLLVVPAVLFALSPVVRADEVEDRRSPVVRAVEKSRPGVVAIRTNEIVQVPRYYDWFFNDGTTVPQEREGSLGSGAIFHPAGFVLTNAHVISRASKVIVQLTRPGGAEQEREARVVAVDLDNDLAILKLVSPDGSPETYPFLPLGRSDDVMLGETVIAIGNPFKLGITVTTGIVSALHRTIRPQRAEEQEFRDFIQTDAAINPGNSGGPLLDVTGRWIGVNTAILNRATGAEGIGFAIPADRVREMVGRTFKRRLVNGEWTGFDLDESPSGSPVVREVYATGPAAESGLKAGDRVVAVNGRATASLFDYRLAEVDAPAGGTLRVRVARKGEADRDVEVPLRPAQGDALAVALTRLGFRARDATTADVRTLGVPAMGGVVITEVATGGPAERVRLRVNDVIVALGPFKVRSLDDLLFVLEMVRAGDAVTLRIRRVVQDRFGGAAVRELSGTLVAD
ncbi:MAG: trypsin-like peptidase domain-containing protein [Planctomycetes bacterium]|nr:trypsin-like peptidase domain-containing protein [Planctomycetota bacterium]